MQGAHFNNDIITDIVSRDQSVRGSDWERDNLFG